MDRNIIINDIKRNKFISFVTSSFVSVSAMLIGLTVLLFAGLIGSIDHLMEVAVTPDFIQMHAGEIDESSLQRFAQEQKTVEYWQICNFLNIENGIISLGGHSLADSTQDNGLCVQSEQFDYLLTTDNQRAIVKEGEVFVPVCYQSEYALKQGDTMQIGKETLIIAGFIRDSQMNSMMASSKRFLVHSHDFERFIEDGSIEYLIEFKLAKGNDINGFADAYARKGLPANGPTITYSLVRMINALSDGMMILILFLISVVVMLISMLCIRFIMLTGLAKDKKEIGMLKAIGLSERDIRNIYFSKFLVLSIPGALLGEILAFVVEGPLSVQMQKLYGTGETQMQLYVVSVIAIILMECVLFTFIYFTLRKIEKLSAVEALRGTSETRHKKKGQFIVMGVAIAASLFMILIPQNLLSTISSSKFVTYMGIGNSQIRMDLRQTDDILYKTKELSEVLNADQRVEAYTALVTKKVQTRLLDGTNTTLLMEWGNHSIFPVSYISGGAPMKEGQLALSVLNAKDLKLNMGDKVYLSMKGIEQQYEICGIYSDITNGGKTAKAFTENLDLNETRDDTNMWSILYVSLHDDTGIDTWISDYQTKIGTGAGTGGKITDIKEYLDGTYGGTIRQIHLTSTFVLCVSCLISFIVILLFVRLMVEEKSMAYSLKKALGFTTRELRLEYLIQSLWIVVPAIVAGIISGIFLGEIITGNVIKSLGAAEFKFILNPWMVFVWVPFVMFCVVMLAVRLGLSGISKISAYECLTGKE